MTFQGQGLEPNPVASKQHSCQSIAEQYIQYKQKTFHTHTSIYRVVHQQHLDNLPLHIYGLWENIGVH